MRTWLCGCWSWCCVFFLFMESQIESEFSFFEEKGCNYLCSWCEHMSLFFTNGSEVLLRVLCLLLLLFAFVVYGSWIVQSMQNVPWWFVCLIFLGRLKSLSVLDIRSLPGQGRPLGLLAYSTYILPTLTRSSHHQ